MSEVRLQFREDPETGAIFVRLKGEGEDEMLLLGAISSSVDGKALRDFRRLFIRWLHRRAKLSGKTAKVTVDREQATKD